MPMAVDRAVIALNRFGLGPRPGDTRRIAADPLGALMAELKPEFVAIKNPVLEPTTEIRTEIAEQRKMQAAARKGAAGDAAAAPAPPTISPQAIQDAKNPKQAAKNSIPGLADLKA